MKTYDKYLQNYHKTTLTTTFTSYNHHVYPTYRWCLLSINTTLTSRKHHIYYLWNYRKNNLWIQPNNCIFAKDKSINK